MRRMQPLCVVACLPSGKMSNCAPKNPLVCFEDAGVGDGNGSGSSQSGNGNKGNTRASGSQGMAKQKSSSSNDHQDPRNGSGQHIELIQELQQRWTCKTHSKGSKSLTYCYTPSGGDMCYPLTTSNLSFWAVAIINGKTTVDEKPIGLPLGDPKPHSNLSGHSFQPGPQYVGHSGFPPLGYGYPPPPIIQIYPPAAPGYDHGGNELTAWFNYLTQDVERSRDGIPFSHYGHILKE
ncbi:hypothetical protein J3R82DRAFT_6971 [Butyriboletus roseoflavus]|nr:hypothetical protein J3R82DRAFT_6971 [Butyriboletus roseoflavus]